MKKYLVDDNFKYKLVIIKDNLIKDEEDENKYNFIDQNKK